MLSTLNVSQTGLNAAQVAVENVSNNIANENTPGYKKRVVNLSEISQTSSSLTGQGVDASSSYRITSQYMYDNIISENSKVNEYEKLSSTLGNVEFVFNETDQSGFSIDLNNYLQSVENLRSNPTSEIAKTTLKNDGNNLVKSLQNIYSSIEKQEALEKEDLYSNVSNINDILQEIGYVNEKLGEYNSSTNALLDKRDLLEKELSQYIDIDVSTINDSYELKISGETVVRSNINVNEVSIEEEQLPQIDKYVQDDASNINIGTFDNDDIISYKINNEFEVSVQNGEVMDFDVDGDGTLEIGVTVDSSNYIRALSHKINTTTELANLVEAYNGNYQVDEEGNENLLYPDQDNFLLVKSKVSGTEGSFEGRITLLEQGDDSDSLTITNKANYFVNEDYSDEAQSRVYLAIYEKEVPVNSGILKSQIDNLDSTSYNNKIQSYKDKLDSFAQTLSDLTDNYLKSGEEYVYGDISVDSATDSAYLTSESNNINLFSGSDVMSLKFNENSVNDLDQKDLDYLSTLQWKKDISFTGEEQDPSNSSASSLSEFFQELRISVASDKENNDFLLETQESVVQSLESSYDLLTKVDSDEEMINLIKFQAAYTANAKIITTIDEMLQVLLGLKS